MKNMIFLVALSFFALNGFSQQGIIVEGIVEGAQEEYVSLAYSPRFRGNLNFDGFKSTGSYLDKKGNFKLSADHITNAASYVLSFPKTGMSFNLFEGDSIHFEISLADIDQAFATGRGAGKINILRLAQFQYDFFEVDKERNIDELVDYADSVITYKLSLLEAIYTKTINAEPIANATNKSQILKIIEHAPLSLAEYEFIANQVHLSFYLLFDHFLSLKAQKSEADSQDIDLHSTAFRHFNKEVYQQLDHLNNMWFANSLDVMLQVEYLREKQIKVNYANWKSLLRTSDYSHWVTAFLQKNFSTKVFNQYHAESTAMLMTLGYDHEEMLNSLDLNADTKYTSRLKAYEHLLNNGLNEKEYGLSQDSRTLDQTKFQKLLDQYENSPVLIVFWSAQFAGSSIIEKLPALKAFENDYEGVIDMIYICIDKEVHQNLWAARVVDESWKGEHYFLPMEGNDTILNKFSDKKISSFCNGGATYAFIDKDGTLNSEIEAPYNIRRSDVFYIDK